MQSNLFKQTALPSHYLVIRGFSSGEDVINVWQNTLPNESCDYDRRGIKINVLCRHFDFHLADRSKGLNYPLACKSMNWMVFTLHPRPSFFCNATVWSIANPLLSEGGTRCYSSQRQFPHCRRLSVPLPISSTFFPRALLGHTSGLVHFCAIFPFWD